MGYAEIYSFNYLRHYGIKLVVCTPGGMMLKHPTLIHIFVVAITIYMGLAIVYAVVGVWNLTLLWGWLFGGFAAMLSFSAGAWLINRMRLKGRSRWQAFWAGFCRTIVQMLLHGLLLIALIAINTVSNNVPLIGSGMRALQAPINFFTYLSGIFLMTISTIIAVLIDKRKGKNARVQR